MVQPRRWIDELLDVFHELDGIAHYKQVYETIRIRGVMDLTSNTNWQAAVRRTVEQYSSDSEAFLNKEDFFYTVKGKGKGVWGLREILQADEKRLVSKLTNEITETEIENIFEADDELVKKILSRINTIASIEERQVIIKARKASRAVISKLKQLYDHSCQLCRSNHNSRYGVNVVEAHHIEHFSISQNHHPSNLVILCPTHHRLVHAGKATYLRDRQLFVYENGYEETLKLNKHL
ncbi:hypothetical protein CIG75_09480 [Tumebacillus algifaecis]|uniref:HNH nuclease domain-containing protein n=1 Tax=Tumebacillus algifaecis TaxID=1214604 RepID=A0A223D0Q6_9BACL|nr:HNH endonuclease signature motif containing protein [Tumebacillus algifaecis]ASS75190.1 hypothetical protein CIG75_09480 [Tumebacillus algifaecis]